MTRFASFAAITAVLLAAAALPAGAAQAQSTTKVLRISADDLRTPAGQDALRHRVHLAARAVCGPVEPFNSPDYVSYTQCIRTAEQGALQRVNALVAQAGSTTRFASN
jgi:UrcA family protein